MICPKTHREPKIPTCQKCLYFKNVRASFGSEIEIICSKKETHSKKEAKVLQTIQPSGIEGLWRDIEILHQQIRETGDTSLQKHYLVLLTTYAQANEVDIDKIAELLQEIETTKEDIDLAEEVGGEALEECLSRYELASDQLWAVSGMEV